MSDKKNPPTTWSRICDLSLPNQVKALCDRTDELVLVMDKLNSAETKPPQK